MSADSNTICKLYFCEQLQLFDKIEKLRKVQKFNSRELNPASLAGCLVSTKCVVENHNRRRSAFRCVRQKISDWVDK